MKNKLKEVLSEIKYPVFAGMKPEVSFKNQFSDDAFEYIVRDMIARGITVEVTDKDTKHLPLPIPVYADNLEAVLTKAFNAGMAYGITEYMKTQGHFNDIETKRIVKELLKDVK